MVVAEGVGADGCGCGGGCSHCISEWVAVVVAEGVHALN